MQVAGGGRFQVLIIQHKAAAGGEDGLLNRPVEGGLDLLDLLDLLELVGKVQVSVPQRGTRTSHLSP